MLTLPCKLRYDERLLKSLERLLGRHGAAKLLEYTCMPPERLYVRVNTLRAEPGEVLDRIRAEGLRVYHDEFLEEALWFPIEGPRRVPIVEKKVVVDKRTAESVLLGANVYVPGVLNAEGVCKGDEVNIVTEDGVIVAYGVAESSWEEARRRGKGLFIRVLESIYRAPSTRELSVWKEGLIYEQSLPAMWASRLLDPKPGEVIVDMCAAPGGKTSHIIELSRGKARVVAFDHSSSKIRRMVEELRRLGHLDKVVVEKADSRYIDLDYPMLRADKVLLDPPCTALGVVPKVQDSKSMGDVLAAAEYQRQFLKVAARILKPGGILVYSTCTVTLEENELNVLWAAEKLGFTILEVHVPRASRGWRGVGVRFYQSVQRLPGYYIAVLRRR